MPWNKQKKLVIRINWRKVQRCSSHGGEVLMTLFQRTGTDVATVRRDSQQRQPKSWQTLLIASNGAKYDYNHVLWTITADATPGYCHNLCKFFQCSKFVLVSAHFRFSHTRNEIHVRFTSNPKWCWRLNLSINVSKTKCILFRSSKSKPPPTNLTVTLRNIKIEQVTTMKFLGVHIDEHLTWTGHIRHLQNKLRSTLGVVSRIKPFLRQGSMLTLYHSLINSHLQYCITNWCIGNKTLINKLQKTCNKFIRMACNLRHYRDVTDVRKTHQLLTINQLLTKEIAVFMFKQNSGKNPDVFRNVFVKSISQYNTRNRSKLIPKPCSSSLCQQSISYQGPAIWSKLPIFFKNEKMSVVTFSAKLRNYLCTNSIGIWTDCWFASFAYR